MARCCPSSLVTGDVRGGADGRTADLAGALGDVIGHGEDLLGMLVEEQVIVAEIGAGDVPVEAPGLEIEGKDIGQKAAKGIGERFNGFGLKPVEAAFGDFMAVLSVKWLCGSFGCENLDDGKGLEQVVRQPVARAGQYARALIRT